MEVFFVLFIGAIIFNQNPTQINKMANSTNLSNHQANVSKPSGSDDLQYIEYPYFENLTGISQWVQNDMLDTSSKIPEFYSETNETGNLTDMTHNFEDFGVALDGLLPATIYNGYDYLLPDYFLSQEQTPFYDSNSSSQGFYTTTSGDWTQNSTEGIVQFYGPISGYLC